MGTAFAAAVLAAARPQAQAGAPAAELEEEAAAAREEALCPHCRAAPETVIHRWWDCAAFEENRRLVGVQELAKQGRKNGFQPACFWQNGLLPMPATTTTPSAFMQSPVDAITAPAHDALDGDRRPEVWTDGAADHADTPQLRRAGWGVWMPGAAGASIAQPLVGP